MSPAQPMVHGLVLAVLCTACATAPDQPTAWASDNVSLQTTGTGATLQFLADGGCYGSSGAVDQAIPSGDFSLTGTYTQLMGVAPGFVRYPARFTGTVAHGAMTITVSVPTLPLTLGPYRLAAGVTKSWPACLYP